MICVRPDAQKKIHGLSPVVPSVIQIVMRDDEFWPAMDQLIKTMKPVVDTLGNCESREASLASCMLEFIRCAKKVSQIPLDNSDNIDFWNHAKSVFNRRFHAMDTSVHSLALFLHPMCRKLAISQVANGRSFQFMVQTALSIAQQWRWNEDEAKKLVYDLKEYQKCAGPFNGGQANALEWWECLSVTAKQCPLKAMAIIIHSIVPHAAEVERYFSGLGGTQSVKRCNLSVETFESLSKLRSNYSYHLYQMDRAAGKSTHRKHGHMHTQLEPGIDISVATDLEATFSWVPPLAAESLDSDDYLAGPESIAEEELDQAFDELDREKAEAAAAGVSDKVIDNTHGVLAGKIYDWVELERVDKGTKPVGFNEEINVLSMSSEGAADAWDVGALMTAEGVTSLF
ncbi:hypothetical protein BJ138DRAFT_1225824 [Hygrophoropsis aurantiaca]|uniref:Uncharacterized protein n=1 Tax=Hygrophoropsis aurantiaca TaxID=72124 RepID=A0ACB7ZYZ7_9AGAM|nr:hypothetical protein BJ138DRAFT_1225824 [Hygrophoropsis aurantiaca]